MNPFSTRFNRCGGRGVLAACGWLALAGLAGSWPAPARGQCTWQEIAQLTASDAAASDEFGRSMAVSGDTAVFGAHYDDNAAGIHAGSAYVFVRSGPPAGEVWTEQAKLTASDAAASDNFGGSVAASGDTVVVGAFLNDHAGGTNAGAAYVFIRVGGVWTEQAKLIASNAATEDYFGGSVAVSGDTAVIGASGSGDDQAVVYVFVRSGGIWSQQAILTASDAATGDRFGNEVALSGDTAVVGAYGDDHADEDAGSAYVFVRSGSVWTEQAKLTASDAAYEDFFGRAVAVSDDTAVIGAHQDNNAFANAGSAYVFVRSGNEWTEQAKLIASDGALLDEFGYSVAVSGDMAAVGASIADHAGGVNAGAAYIFTRSGASGSEVWSEQTKLTASDAAMNDFFGVSVALSGKTALVGSYADDHAGGEDAGSVYAFECLPVPGCPVAITASDAAAGDEFGVSVAIDGDTAVVGARLDDNATGVNAGTAYVYVRSGLPGSEVWTEQARLIGEEPIFGSEAGNQSGISVAISGDTAIVGSWLWPVGTASGLIYIFGRSGPPGGEVWTQQFALACPQFGSYQYYGYSLALEGETALIGSLVAAGLNVGGQAFFAMRAGPPGGEYWMQQHVYPSDGVPGDQFGNAVAMSPSQDTAIVGAWYEDNAGGIDAGSAYIFVRTGPNPQFPWFEHAKLTASDGAPDDQFGVKVAISGDTAIVGAHRADLAGAPNAGSAYVFTRSGPPGSEVWIQQAKLTASDAAAGDHFGTSLALSGDTLVVGAYADDYVGGSDAGSAYVFTRSGPPGSEVWIQQAKLTSPDPAADDWFGVAVALAGDTPVIGARQADNAGGVNAGSAYVFDLNCTGTPCPGDRGDTNCDGSVNFFDIDPFLLALFDLPTYQATLCGGQVCTADTDCSGQVNFFDIDPFLACLFGGCPACP